MMKWIILGAVFFVWFIAPPLFRLMVDRDKASIQNGLRESYEAQFTARPGATKVQVQEEY